MAASGAHTSGVFGCVGVCVLGGIHMALLMLKLTNTICIKM